MGLSADSKMPNDVAQGMYVQILRRHPYGVSGEELLGFVKRNYGQKVRKDAVDSYLGHMETDLKLIRVKNGRYILS